MFSKIIRSRFAAVSAGAVLIVGLGAGGAVAGSKIGSDDIRNFAIKKHHISHGAVGAFELRWQSVGSPQIQNGSMRFRDLTPWMQDELKDRTEIRGIEDRVSTVEEEVGAANSFVAHTVSTPDPDQWGTTVTQIGGSIGGRNDTKLVSVLLEPGTYMIDVDGAFMYPGGTQPHDPSVSLWPQLSLWTDVDEKGDLDWNPTDGGDGSISPNALMPSMNDRHITVSGSTLLTVTDADVQGGTDAETVPVRVSAFGYDSEQGQAGEGELQAIAELGVVQVEAPGTD